MSLLLARGSYLTIGTTKADELFFSYLEDTGL